MRRWEEGWIGAGSLRDKAQQLLVRQLARIKRQTRFGEHLPIVPNNIQVFVAQHRIFRCQSAGGQFFPDLIDCRVIFALGWLKPSVRDCQWSKLAELFEVIPPDHDPGCCLAAFFVFQDFLVRFANRIFPAWTNVCAAIEMQCQLASRGRRSDQ
jgi:hypothetical protein